jgi:VCBS repeat-containing protein
LTTSDGNNYGYWSGTSFSAPITASVLNLVYSVDPTLTSAEAFDILKNSAADLGPAGFDIQFGHGRVDAYAAIFAASGNSPPITAANDAYATDEEILLAIAAPGILVNDSDPSGGSLTAVLSTSVANGALNLSSNGSFTYSPNQNFDGVDSFTYHATNGTANSYSATVTITVNPVNDAPVAQDDSANTFENTLVVIDVLANDSDVDGDTLNIQSITQGDSGTVSDNGDGTLSYTPNLDFTGADSFTYQMNDGSELNDSATVNVTVNPIIDVHVGDLEITKSGKKRWTAFVSITIHNDTDYSMPGLTVEGTWSGGSSGTDSCVTNSDGWCQASMVTKGESLTFTVDNITGVGYQYTGPNHDVSGNSNGTSITINKDGTIPGPNASPDAVNDIATTTQGQPVDVDVLSNDSDPNGDTLSIESVTQGLLGTVSINGGMVRYTPVDGNMGPDSFTYTINDGNGETDTATVNVTINEPPPVTYVHVGVLDGVLSSKGPWNTVTVTITVHDDSVPHTIQSGVIVSGTWTGLFSGDDTCTTDESGSCSVKDRSKNSDVDAEFIVTDMSGNGFVYEPANNDVASNISVPIQ